MISKPLLVMGLWLILVVCTCGVVGVRGEALLVLPHIFMPRHALINIHILCVCSFPQVCQLTASILINVTHNYII